MSYLVHGKNNYTWKVSNKKQLNPSGNHSVACSTQFSDTHVPLNWVEHATLSLLGDCFLFNIYLHINKLFFNIFNALLFMEKALFLLLLRDNAVRSVRTLAEKCFTKMGTDYFCSRLEGLAQAKIIKKSVILFRVLNMTIWCKHVHRLELQIFIIFVLRIHQLG